MHQLPSTRPSHRATRAQVWQHKPSISRRDAITAGAIGLCGLGMNHLAGLRAVSAADRQANNTSGFGKAKSCIFIFLSGGLAQHDSFDMKPAAPDNIRGEFSPIATATPGLQICEHLPMLAERSQKWALCRSLTHPSNDHSAGHHIMLTGRTQLPPGFSPNTPSRSDFPSIAALAGYAANQAAHKTRNNLPPSVVLPERLVHNSGRVIPGQHGGIMGAQHDPWFVEASPFHTTSYGAFPDYKFDHQDRGNPDERKFQAPQLNLPHGLGIREVNGRLELLGSLNDQQRFLAHAAQAEQFDRFRQSAVSLLTDQALQKALDVTRLDDKTVERYGRNSFGWSLLMARRLVSVGVNLVQVNLGNNETWDTHGNAFPHLKDNLFPPTDRALSALIDDLESTGELDETLIVMAGEFGRTPKITLLQAHYKMPGRDHWGAVQSVLMAGGGVRGGTVIGRSDAIGAYPADQPVSPEDFAATIYNALGIPRNADWHDASGRPHQVYYGEPIAGLT